MGKRYENPPVVEVVCEFRFTPDTSWDMTVPGLIYEQVRKEYPNREQHLFQEVQLASGSEGLEQHIRPGERLRFLDPDRITFLQVGTRILSIHSLRPYPGWTNFKPRIERALDALSESVEITRIQRLGLRYINRIEIPGDSIELEKHFEFRPFLGSRMPKGLTEFIVGCIVPFREETDVCKIQLTSAGSETTGRSSFGLDLDYFLTKPGETAPDGVSEWVEAAHERVENLFESCLTPQTREIFGEGS